mgnify:CR=1 FL=1
MIYSLPILSSSFRIEVVSMMSSPVIIVVIKHSLRVIVLVVDLVATDHSGKISVSSSEQILSLHGRDITGISRHVGSKHSSDLQVCIEVL